MTLCSFPFCMGNGVWVLSVGTCVGKFVVFINQYERVREVRFIEIVQLFEGEDVDGVRFQPVLFDGDPRGKMG